jgi:hypothetical protein
MKQRLAVMFLALLLCTPAHAAMTGRDVMVQQQERHSVKSGVVVEEMLLVDQKGNEEKRLFKILAKELDDGARRFAAVFLEPSDVRGAALLAVQPAQGDSKLMLYLPAAGAVQHIRGGSKKNAFMGSDFTYEDLEPERIDNFDYRILKSEFLDGQNCWVVEAVPADREKARAMATLRVEFYDRRGRLEKFLVNKELMVWRPRVCIMENARTGHKTVLTLQGEEKVNVPLDDSLFTEEALVQKRLLDAN